MKTKNYSTLLCAGAVTTALCAVAQPANAFSIVNTSATWDNVLMRSGSTVGSSGIAADATNLVKFLDDGGVDQVRWGQAAYGGYYEKVTTRVPQTNRRGRVKRDRRGRIKYKNVTSRVWVPPTYENQSGLGFEGVSDLNLDLGQTFNIGTLSHFNQTIYTNDFIGESAEISLNLDFGDNSIGTKTFKFALGIDETANYKGRNNNGASCAYQTDAGLGCSDKISWDFLVDQNNSFTHEGEDYELELVGFAESLASQDLTNHFISQEEGNSSASLFARLVKLGGDSPATPEDIPEPAALLGLAGLGAYFVRSRKQRAETLLA